MTTSEDIDKLIQLNECENIEFKLAQNSFNFDKLTEYVVALANERGGQIVLGVTPQFPRSVKGTLSFGNLESTKLDLLKSVGLRVDVDEVSHPSGRVLVFRVPSRPIGSPLHVNGKYLMRSGESLVPMSPDQLQRIFAEGNLDFTSQICSGITLDALDAAAIEVFRERWVAKSKNDRLRTMSVQQLLEDAELTVENGVTYAALILLGTRSALGRHLANAELVFEYRSSESQIAHSHRIEFRQGFLSIHDEVWDAINLRNEVVSIREGLFRTEMPSFNEDMVREAVLNAVCHRDYRLGGSVFILQSPQSLRIVSPGGFPEGVTTENILNRQLPRNRRLAEACSKCGLVERSGQGMDRIFGIVLREGKSAPDFSGTDTYQVSIAVRADQVDKRFLGLLELAERHGISLDVSHLVVLDVVRSERAISEEMKPLVKYLIKIGLLERHGRGRGSRISLSRGMYRVLGEAGVHTRVEGLDRETNKELLLKHARQSGAIGASLEEFRQVLPSLTSSQVRHMVYELRDEGKLRSIGRTRGSKWLVNVDA